jgi:hypothetical protein
VTGPLTQWKITALLDWGRVDLTLSVDTEARVVLDMIEQAAEKNGIVLQRIEPEQAA